MDAFKILTHLCLASSKVGQQILAKIAKKTRALMGYTKNQNFYRVPYLQIFVRSVMMILNLLESLGQAASHGKTEHGIFVKFIKPSKIAVVLIAGVTISGTPCPRHITVPFGAEALSGHVAQA